MSNLTSRKILEECCGGLKNLTEFMAEDFFMAKMIRDKGYTIELASNPALQNSRSIFSRAVVKILK